ncbi:hypothetical protein E2C01_071738 [Portunus trituberculatus]|uniref:Uncharacterized protein n=1 Tax=Portunus trituberculatus TaxID=210409 RepID=A0A5B7I703_PORTR|nr:hypothetical protein [Portunus trituberculatus]
MGQGCFWPRTNGFHLKRWQAISSAASPTPTEGRGAERVTQAGWRRWTRGHWDKDEARNNIDLNVLNTGTHFY